MTRKRAAIGLAGAIAVLALIAVSPLVGGQGRPLGSLIGAAGRLKGGDTVIATVNGEGITLSGLEATRAALQATSANQIDDSTAYRQAMDYLIRNKVLVQEARRRGLSVAEQEARDYMAKMKAEGDPEAARLMQDQAEAAGLSDREWEERAVAAYQEGLLIGKLHEVLREETPRPTQEDIDGYLVLKTVTTSIQEARAAAESELFEERYTAYVLQVEEELRRQAEVEVLKDRLPADVAAALADW